MSLDDFGRFSEPALYILLALANGPKHGYALGGELDRLTGRHCGPGTLYGPLGRLVEKALVEPLAGEGRREPDALTAEGSAVAGRAFAQLSCVVALAASRLRQDFGA